MSNSSTSPERSSFAGVDTTTPSVARAYDYAIGGKNNYEVDRELLRQLDEAVPEVKIIAVANRSFLIRAVRYLAEEAGIDQFLDCGSGLPTAENTHQVAQRSNESARVIYVDNDPVVVTYGRALLEENEHTHFLDADIFEPSEVLDSELVRERLDFTRPMALMQVATMHHHSAELGTPPVDVMRAYIDAIPSGSYVVFSHFFDPENEYSEVAQRVQTILNSSISRGFFRTRAEITKMLEGLELVDPGLVVNGDWRPDTEASESLPAAQCIVGAVGRKP